MQIYPFRVPRRCISCNSFAVTQYADRANVRGSLGRITNERTNERIPPWGETRALIHEIYLSKVCSLKARAEYAYGHTYTRRIYMYFVRFTCTRTCQIAYSFRCFSLSFFLSRHQLRNNAASVSAVEISNEKSTGRIHDSRSFLLHPFNASISRIPAVF